MKYYMDKRSPMTNARWDLLGRPTTDPDNHWLTQEVREPMNWGGWKTKPKSDCDKYGV